MSKTIRFWLNGDANGLMDGYTCTVTTDQLGITDEAWNAMEKKQRDDLMKSFAFKQIDMEYSDE